MSDTFSGFNLFNDIDDDLLRIRNRAVVLANMYCDNSKDGKTTPKGAYLVLGYFSKIPEYEREAVQAKFVEDMSARGYQLS